MPSLLEIPTGDSYMKADMENAVAQTRCALALNTRVNRFIPFGSVQRGP